MTERSTWHVLGRVIGTATGWDQAETFSIYVYDLEPVPCLGIPPGDVTIDFEAGKIIWIDEAGDHAVDLIAALQGCKRD